MEYQKPNVLFALYFNLPANDFKVKSTALPNVYVCSGPDLDLDFDYAVIQVKILNLEQMSEKI